MNATFPAIRVLLSRSAQASLVCVLLASSSVAAESWLYVLKSKPNLEQSIVRFDPETGSERPVANFIFSRGLIGPFETLRLTATGDRIIAHGNAFYEFDAPSGQLLRRYDALSGSYDSWGFRGVAVDLAMAKWLGVEPGYYGLPFCGAYGPATCPLNEPFPGHTDRTNRVEQHVFFRRGFDPGDTSLSIAKIFDPSLEPEYGPTTRLTALDLERRQFWFWLQGSADNVGGYVSKLTSAAITAGAIGNESVMREERRSSSDPRDRMRFAEYFVFDSLRESLFLGFTYPLLALEKRLIRQTVEGYESIVSVPSGAGTNRGITVLTRIQPETFVQLLPGVGETAGLNGTYWRSDAWLFNPSDAEATVTLRRVSLRDKTYQVTLGPRASMKIANVLREMGGGPTGDGSSLDAVIVESPYRAGAQLSVYSRTYTTSPTGGTYGQAVPAVPSLVGYSNYAPGGDLSESYSMFILDKRDPQQFRHNFGVVNTSGEPVTIGLRYANISTQPPHDPDLNKTLVVPPHSMRQYSMEGLFKPEIMARFSPSIFVTSDRPVVMSMSMVDNLTGDASFIPFSHYGVDVGPSARLVIPAVASTNGVNGTFWKTDGYGVFWHHQFTDGSEPQRPDANFYPASGSCEASAFRLTPSAGITRNPAPELFWRTTFVDLARQGCPNGGNALGALEVRTGSWMSFHTRTYTTREDGGTYGEVLPLYPPNGWPSRHFPGIEVNSRFRVNLGFYNGSSAQSKAALKLYKADGALAAERILELDPRESAHNSLQQLFGELDEGLYALSVITLEGTGSWPSVSTVDNITGDPTNWW
jgi:hypothetical protein